MNDNRIIELMVDNHPGVMYRITGLFSRRAFNIEGILCRAVEGSDSSRMFLLVREDGRLGNIVKQLRNLYEVREVVIHGAESPCRRRMMDLIGPMDAVSETEGIEKVGAMTGTPTR